MFNPLIITSFESISGSLSWKQFFIPVGWKQEWLSLRGPRRQIHGTIQLDGKQKVGESSSPVFFCAWKHVEFYVTNNLPNLYVISIFYLCLFFILILLRQWSCIFLMGWQQNSCKGGNCKQRLLRSNFLFCEKLKKKKKGFQYCEPSDRGNCP